MYIHGEFKNERNETYSVHISDGVSSSGEMIIGEDELFFSNDPVTIETECEDNFTHIIKKSCSIRLVTSKYLGDYLFNKNVNSVVVNVLCDGVCLFAGFVEPNIYTQPYANYYEEIEINCTDFLSSLEYSYLTDNTTYNDVKASASVVTFYDLLVKLDLLTAKLSINQYGGISNSSGIYYDNSKSGGSGSSDIFRNLAISENLFLGDEEDDLMNNEEILNEILKYLNLHIIQEGYKFYIFDWNSIKNAKVQSGTNIYGIEWINLYTNAKYNYGYYFKEITKDDYISDGTNIELSEVYNQIQVKCDIKSMDTIIESPMESNGNVSVLTSDFGNYQKFMTELYADGEGDTAFNSFKNLIKNGSTDYDAGGSIDWYMQVKKNPGWGFYHKNQEIYSKLLEKDSNGNCINQWKFAKYLRDNKFACCLMSLGKSKKINLKDDTPNTKINMSDYLVISCNGNLNDSESQLNTTSSELESSPLMCKYLGSMSGIYSPADNSTTNYLVFSGKMVLAPLLQQTGAKWDTDYNKTTNTYKEALANIDKYSDKTLVPLLKYKTCPYGENGDGRYYIFKFWEQREAVKGTPVYNSSNYSVMMYPFIEIQRNEDLAYNYSSTGDSTDKISKLPVLECELKIGDKYCVEEYEKDSTGIYHSIYKWYTYANCPTYNDNGTTKKKTTFSLGINPAIGDYILGKEYDIATNFDTTYNIDADNGTAIPIRFEDHLVGNISFKIIGPINTTWDEITRRHPTWFRHTKWYTNTKSILSHCSNIFIKDFECKIYTDNAGYQNSGENDLIYVSDETKQYIKKKDDIEFKINTALTSEESNKLEIENTVNLSSVIDSNSKMAITSINNNLTNVTAKPEEFYCNDYWEEFNKPKLIVETEIYDEYNTSPFRKYSIGYLNKTFYPISMTRNIKRGSVLLRLKEI